MQSQVSSLHSITLMMPDHSSQPHTSLAVQTDRFPPVQFIPCSTMRTSSSTSNTTTFASFCCDSTPTMCSTVNKGIRVPYLGVPGHAHRKSVDAPLLFRRTSTRWSSATTRTAASCTTTHTTSSASEYTEVHILKLGAAFRFLFVVDNSSYRSGSLASFWWLGVALGNVYTFGDGSVEVVNAELHLVDVRRKSSGASALFRCAANGQRITPESGKK